jgi:branched-chain amino acid aminotransferase
MAYIRRRKGSWQTVIRVQGYPPITKISGKNINKGAVGDITRKIHKLYWDKHSDPDWSVSIDDII